MLSESVSVCALDSLTFYVVTAGECDIYIYTDAVLSKATFIQGTHYHAFPGNPTSDASHAYLFIV